ncbi:MAG: DMT family transporter [Alphaproteobacteria bacterium]|nr:DMT family transporter [Alphaproteobacteria bacterium]
MGPFLPAAAAAGTGILVGAAMVATRFVIAETDPASLALLRYLIGTLCLAPPLLASGWVRIAPRDWLPIALLGIGQFGILIALLNYGLQFIGSGMGALIFATVPLLTMVLAASLRLEQMTWLKSAGVVLTIAGVGFALAEKLSLGGTADTGWQGEIAVFASALTGAVCAVFYRPYLKAYPALQVSTVAMLASVLFLAVLAAGEGFFGAVPRFSPGGWFCVLFIGVSSGIGYYLWLWALAHATPTRVTVFLALGPITATALGALVLDERVSLWFLAGLGAVALGLWLAHRRG